MTVFDASNGIGILIDEDGDLDFRNRIGWSGLCGGTVVHALREFFQHERDKELGRWRWPENPDYVVYSNPDEAFERMFGPNLDLVILRDSDGMTKGYVREEDQGGPPMDHRIDHILAARAYFEAHPERKPWEDATYKDVWVWTTADNTQEALGWVAGDGTWDIITPKGDGIKAAEKPMVALVDAGFEKFSGTVTGVRRTPEDAS
ncbi:hypothetical protein ILP86_04560 [Microbacterium sp. R1]|uniref:Uncharacterized protein n=1 Tax=Microbacterium phage vB_MoxS-R1 TaxID=2848881 RepID=A0A8F2E4X8_9CAUD|nr:hypothetical protein [Microbacterium sp. R1]YP_010649899.1 hypothetical protein PP419_gp19 [Microbacterium phage vB_MoxS-R1]MBE7953592.1 hypothetical protein [Microbacterium sp. R1]QWT28869.1 hypothetical protein vBMoxSR1_gp19 [Microbacterium phage vB_MoxS-R1]